jgi:hypothetical protein
MLVNSNLIKNLAVALNSATHFDRLLSQSHHLLLVTAANKHTPFTLFASAMGKSYIDVQNILRRLLKALKSYNFNADVIAFLVYVISYDKHTYTQRRATARRRRKRYGWE